MAATPRWEAQVSASEKLRALQPEGVVQTEDANQGYHDAVLLSPPLLSLIADVVEAAEPFAEAKKTPWTVEDIEALDVVALHRALSALNEALA